MNVTYQHYDSNSDSYNTLFEVPFHVWIGNEMMYDRIAETYHSDDAFVTDEVH